MPFSNCMHSYKTWCRHTSGIVVSDTDCGAVGSGLESWIRYGCVCKRIMLLRPGGALNSRQTASSHVGGLQPCPGVLSQN
ncbi:hypothetical protein TNCV_9981 [Trichonephila clavipes]|nr:hypothetical protein TNCV_9981 [Trichonephila clavipes]